MAAVTFRVARVAASAVASAQRDNEATKRETAFISTILRADRDPSIRKIPRWLCNRWGQARCRGTRPRGDWWTGAANYCVPVGWELSCVAATCGGCDMDDRSLRTQRDKWSS